MHSNRSSRSNPWPWCREAAMLPTAPPCCPVDELLSPLSVKKQYILHPCPNFYHSGFPFFTFIWLLQTNVLLKLVQWDWDIISGPAKPIQFWLMGWDLFVQHCRILTPQALCISYKIHYCSQLKLCWFMTLSVNETGASYYRIKCLLGCHNGETNFIPWLTRCFIGWIHP